MIVLAVTIVTIGVITHCGATIVADLSEINGKEEHMWTLTRVIYALRARRYYRTVHGYKTAQLPCTHCVWEHDREDPDHPWQWIYCHECDWGNH